MRVVRHYPHTFAWVTFMVAAVIVALIVILSWTLAT